MAILGGFVSLPGRQDKPLANDKAGKVRRAHSNITLWHFLGNLESTEMFFVISLPLAWGIAQMVPLHPLMSTTDNSSLVFLKESHQISHFFDQSERGGGKKGQSTILHQMWLTKV